MFKTDVAGEFPEYLRDESRRTGRADSISFPRSESEVAADLIEAAGQGRAVTVQGARTGIAAGSVPDGGHVINLSRMNRVLRFSHAGGACRVTVEPGLALAELRMALAGSGTAAPPGTPGLDLLQSAGPLTFPPDPTETSAAVGGMIACNASGARTFFYGPTRSYVERLRVVLADGDRLALCRGEPKTRGRSFSVRTDSGRVLEGTLPSYRMPVVKNAAGYYAADDMDLLDLFVGAEGTLGIITEAELRLVPTPPVEWGVMAFLPTEVSALQFVRELRREPVRPVAIEFFDSHALDLLRRQKRDNPAFQEIRDMPPAWHTAVYVEYHGTDAEAVENAVMALSEILVGCGGQEDATWIASSERELAPLKSFRHAVPESVNLLIDERRKREPGLTKLGTDLAVPDDSLDDVFSLYHAGLERLGLEYVMFGHIGNNHVHVNILPRTMDDYRRGRELYLEWAREVVAMGGTVSAEHGIGKLKTALLKTMYGDRGIDEMRAVKRVFDPDGRLSPGNLFEKP